jgi:membrane protein YdbS with pleckstrin-like domain
MNLEILAQVARGDMTMPRIIFWILLILWAIGSFGFREHPYWVRGQAVVLIILFAILGYYLFGF